MFIKDTLQHISTERTRMALSWSLGYCFFASLALGTIIFLRDYSFLKIFIVVIPIGLIHLWAVIKGNKKELLAELSGVMTLGAVAASIVLVSRHYLIQALVVWLVLAIRAVTAVIYVRYRLNKVRGKENNFAFVFFVHVIGLAILGVLVSFYLIKPIIIMAGLLLVLRLFINNKFSITPKWLGIQESFVGAVFVFIVINAFYSL